MPIDLVNWGTEASKSACGARWNLEKRRFSYMILFLWECYCSYKQQCIILNEDDNMVNKSQHMWL